MDRKKSIEEIRVNLIKLISESHRIFTPILKKNRDNLYNCHKNQIRAIMIIGRTKKITPTMLGKYMDMEKGSLTTLLRSLENMNLIYRESDKHDRRKSQFSLSAKGEKYFNKQKEIFRKNLIEIFDCLTDKQIEDFKNHSMHLIDILCKIKGV